MDKTAFLNQYCAHLSEQQRTAVLTTEGPVLLLAVPGGGKTTVLVTRLGYMIHCCGIHPEQILTLTYTVAATRDMEKRYAELFDGEEPFSAAVPEFRTINGICAKIIHYYGRLIGKPPFSLLSDEKLQLRLLSDIWREVENGFATEADLKDVRTQITYIKNRMLTPDEIEALDQLLEYHLAEIYERYSRELRQQGLMDYDDQMVYALTILRRDPATLRHFRNLYPYICVDEAQDTSRVQHEIIRMLAAGTENLFMVGDEDQSIYGFRAAYPQALLEFEQQHAGAQVLLMEDNFRSNAAIVEAADRFIEKNLLRHEKKMRATRPKGVPIRKITLRGRGAQYTYLAKVAASPPGQTAVLYRDNESMIPLADLLEREGIPYQMKQADLTFFTTRVVTDISNIIRFAYDPANTDLFLQIYYKLGLYLSREAAMRAAESARETKIPVITAILRDSSLPKTVQNNCRAFRTSLKLLTRSSASDALTRIIDEMHYGDYLDRSNISRRKLAVLSVLARREASPTAFLDRLAELHRIFNEKEPDPVCLFLLSTIHSSKGLEYDHVYLLDVADGFFPESLPDAALLRKWRRPGSQTERRQRFTEAELMDIAAYEEERRLFYVGVTRAKERLTVFQLPYGSAFLKELLEEPANQHDSNRESAARPRTQQRNGITGADREAEFRAYRESFGVGLAIEHANFGMGVVTAIDGEVLTARFGGAEKKLLLRVLFEKQLVREL